MEKFEKILENLKHGESMFAASGFSLVSLWFQAEKGTLSPLECLSFANTIQAEC